MNSNISYKQIFHFTSNGVIVTDTNRTIVHINSQAIEMLKLKTGSYCGVGISELLPRIGAKVSRCLETEVSKIGLYIERKNSELVLNITLIKEDDDIIGTICNFQELYVYDNLAEQLFSYKKLTKQLKVIIEFFPEGIWVYDGDGKVLVLNPAAEKMDGIKAEDVIGKTYTEVFESGRFDRLVGPEVFKSKKPVSMLSYASKTKKDLLLTGTPVINESGNIELVVVSQRDMTELKKLQKQLNENQKVMKRFKEELAELSLIELKDKEIIAESDSMKQVLMVSVKLAKVEAANILILGESGTGKGLIAKIIHNSSKRKKHPFIQINCAALPENLLEAELFGYEKGAFTGASKEGKIGLLELAHEGTLFLDEIGDLPRSLQAKLLKYLDDYEITRLGGIHPTKVDCTIIAATNRNLKLRVKEKKFRRDLFYRLETFTIQIPPLRERPEDIFELANYFLKKYNIRYKQKNTISNETMVKLQSLPFPGNVRQLKNALKMAMVLCDQCAIDQLLMQKLDTPNEESYLSLTNFSKKTSYTGQIIAAEKRILKEARTKYKSVRMMANHLQISKSTVARKLRRHGIR